MQDRFLLRGNDNAPRGLSLFDAIAAVKRRKRLLAIAFLGVLIGTVAGGLLLDRYKVRMQLLVNNGRAEPVLSADAQHAPGAERVTEERLNSEVALLTSDALLSRVAVEHGLHETAHARFGDNSEAARIQRATAGLKGKLTAQAIRKTELIEVTYQTNDPATGVKILQSLAKHYMQKHKEVRRPPGQEDFFDQQVELSKARLQRIDENLRNFSGEAKVVSPALERDQLLQRMSELNLGAQQSRAAAAEANRRIATLARLSEETPARITRQVRSSDNGALMQQLKSTLLTLELKRTELLSKYQPTYRPVVELETQIAEAKQAIAREEARPLREETTDQNPTHEWVRSELARARADRTSHLARASATGDILRELQGQARSLDNSSIRQQELLRQQQAEQDTYLLYLRKREEARINAAMDERGMLNVTLAQEPVPPAGPRLSFLTLAALGLMAAVGAGAASVVVAERVDPSFHSPDQVRAQLGIPVLAALPERSATNSRSATATR